MLSDSILYAKAAVLYQYIKLLLVCTHSGCTVSMSPDSLIFSAATI